MRDLARTIGLLATTDGAVRRLRKVEAVLSSKLRKLGVLRIIPSTLDTYKTSIFLGGQDVVV